ncbi:MAG: DUF4974 domain-containing protein [Tannerella sp.]|jgi:ferric-dicitrate binding protein FerR (iron transport regulator)|nr:DUF4974 domain-containing protein [Tannerella sp.]
MPDRHNHIEELVIRYLQQDISEEELRELDQWLQEASENKDNFFRLKDIYDSAKGYKLWSEEEIEQSWQRMYRKIFHSHADLPGKKVPLYTPLKYIAVAVVAIALGIGIGEFRENRRPPAETPPQVTAYNEIRVKKGGTPNTLVLSDGTKVMLNAAGALRFPTSFSDSTREVFLDGEAYFEVANDPEKLFIVRLNRQNVIVHGTNFNIEAYRDESYNIVTLLSGSISLETMNGNGEKTERLVLEPGRKAYFDSASGAVSVEEADASLSNAWTKGEYKFKDEPLALIVKRLENYYDVNIHVSDERLKRIKYTGTFSLDQNIQQVLRIINHEKQFLFQQTGNDIYIKRK